MTGCGGQAEPRHDLQDIAGAVWPDERMLCEALASREASTPDGKAPDGEAARQTGLKPREAPGEAGEFRQGALDHGLRGGRLLLRLEGLAVLVGTVVAYGASGGSWGWFAALFLVPDLSLLGYLGGARMGAWAYNFGHSYLGPAVLAGAAFWFNEVQVEMGSGLAVGLEGPAVFLTALIWSAHIGFDRALGYGLKSTRGFRFTHLGFIRGR